MAEPQHLIHIKAALQVKRMPLYEKIIRWTWRVLIGGMTMVALIFLAINFTAIPSFRELEDPKFALASEVLAKNKEVLGRFFIENRVPVRYEDLSPHLVNALISTEDSRFREHCGIDARALARVVFRTLLMADQSSGGGSTITQQLAKLLYSDRDFKGLNPLTRTFKLVYMKLREWITAVKLERSYTKEEIIAMYLNQFNFINNAYGIHAASEIYFGKTPKTLKIEEAATLIGMLQNPAYFNPNRYPDRCRFRRMIVLYQMKNNKHLTVAKFDSLKVLPLDMGKFKKVTFTDDKAPYLCDAIEKDLKTILNAPECLKPDGTKYDIYKDGLKIHTTIDPLYQRYAEEAMKEQMKKLQARLFTVWKGRDPWSYRTRETTDGDINERKKALWRLVRQGDRFQAQWPKYMDDMVQKVKKRFDFDLRDIDIERMLEEEKNKGSISKMLTARPPEVSVDQAAAYNKIMSDKLWPEIKRQYNSLCAIVRKQYDQKQAMKVFTWAKTDHQKDTFMSPMDSLKYHRMFLQTGILAVDPTTAEIKAWVGGVDFKLSQYDHIRNGRQVGSTFKPFVYATAIAQQGISPCFRVYDQPVTIPARYQNFTHISDWTPKNSTNSYSGASLSLKEALKQSVNSVSAYLMKQMGSTKPTTDLCKNLGITTPFPEGSPAICLGASDLTVMDMTGAYAAFAHDGEFTRPYVINKIEDKNGREIYRAVPDENRALQPGANYVMVDMLKYNVGGAPGINTLKSEVGGKTGTTNNYTDGWFMGITPRLVVGSWVGGEDTWIRFLTLSDGQGARMARPIFAGFLQRLEKDPKSGYDYNARFKKPADLGILVDCSAYGSPPPTGDEEEFSPDIFGDEELPENPDGLTPKGDKKKKPDDGFGDQENDR